MSIEGSDLSTVTKSVGSKQKRPRNITKSIYEHIQDLA